MMSADNGIYIFRTKDQVRVAYAHAIDNLTFSFLDSKYRLHHPGEYVPSRVVEYFGDCFPFTDLVDAVSEAEVMWSNIKQCENGISILPRYDGSWDELLHAAVAYARNELAVLLARASRIYDDDVESLKKILATHGY
jgi:hypothetical protein